MDGERRRRRHAHLAGLDLARRRADLALARRRDDGASLKMKAIVPLAGEGIRVRVTTTDGWNTTTAGVGRVRRSAASSADGLVVVQRLHGRRDLDREPGRQRPEADSRRTAAIRAGRRTAAGSRRRRRRHLMINADGSNRRQVTTRSGQQRVPDAVLDAGQATRSRHRLLPARPTTRGCRSTRRRARRRRSSSTASVRYTRDGSRSCSGARYHQFGYALTRADGTDGVCAGADPAAATA